MADVHSSSAVEPVGLVGEILASLDCTDSTKYGSIIDSVERYLRDKDNDRMGQLAELERLTIINSELMHLWKKGPAEQVAEIAEARENERQLVAATLMQLRKDLVDFDQHVQDADHEYSILTQQNEKLQMDINDLKQLAASVEKELSESTATRVQVNIRLQEQKATLQAYKQKVKEVHWERQDVEEETKLKAQLMRADTQRIQSMTQAEHKNRERAAMEINDVRAAVGRSRCLLKEMRARQRKAAATVAALTTECHELTQINNGFDTDFEHTASRDINRLIQEVEVAEAAAATDEIQTKQYVAAADDDVDMIRTKTIVDNLAEEQDELQRTIEQRAAEDAADETQRTVEGLEAQTVLAKKEIADMTAQLLDMESECEDLEAKIATQQEEFDAIANAKKEATATLQRNAATLERIVADKEKARAKLEEDLEQQRAETAALLEEERSVTVVLETTALRLQEEINECKSKTAASQQHCESCADAEKQAVKQLAEVQRERAEYIAQRDETLQQLEQRRPEAQRQAEHTEQEIVRFQQTLAEAEVARDDAKAAMRVALDELQVAQDELGKVTNDFEGCERTRVEEADLLRKASAKLHAATEEIQRERTHLQLEFDAVKTRDFLARSLNFRLVQAYRKTEKQARDIAAMVQPMRDATVVVRRALVDGKAESKQIIQSIQNSHETFVESLRASQAGKAKRAQLLRRQTTELERVHRALACRIDSIDSTLRSIPPH